MTDLTSSRAYTSSNSSVSGTSATIVAAGTYSYWITIQNTHASQKLSLSFNNPATTSDLTLAAGQWITLTPGATNTLYGIGSGASTTYAIMGA